MVPRSGGSLEIGNIKPISTDDLCIVAGSPFGGIPRNWKLWVAVPFTGTIYLVPPSGGSLEIGNKLTVLELDTVTVKFPLRGDP